MTPRSLRRSQERKARKLARKQARSNAIETPQIGDEQLVQECGTHITSEERPASEPRSNADDSPTEGEVSDPVSFAAQNTLPAPPKAHVTRSAGGPKTAEGKAKSCLNAVKTALTGRTVLLPNDDVERYEQHVSDFVNELGPVGPRECMLVQSIADGTWRLYRISTLEMALFAKGREEFAELFADRDPALRTSLIELHTLLTYEKQLRNLNIQEARLRRQREKDVAELRDLQRERATRQRADLELAAKMYIAAQKESRLFNPADVGFEFSTDDVIAFVDRGRRLNHARQTMQTEIRTVTGHSAAA